MFGCAAIEHPTDRINAMSETSLDKFFISRVMICQSPSETESAKAIRYPVEEREADRFQPDDMEPVLQKVETAGIWTPPASMRAYNL